MPAISLPSKRHWPRFGLSKPVSRLNSVVLPAPFGPISAVIAPRCTSRWSTSTATRPPKLRCTPSATSSGSGFAAPGSAATPSVHAARVGVSAVTDQRLSSIAEDPLWSEDHEQHDRKAHEDEPHDGHLAVVDQPRRQVVVADRLAVNTSRNCNAPVNRIAPTTGPITRA